MNLLLNAKLKNMVSEIKKGNVSSFDELYDMTKNAVYKTAFGILKDYDDSMDILQDTYISVLNSISNISEDKNIYSYILTTAKNKAINKYNLGKRNVPLENAELTAAAEQKNQKGELWRYAEKILSKQDYYLLELLIECGYKRSEAAMILNLPVSTVCWRYKRILKELGKHCSEEDYE